MQPLYPYFAIYRGAKMTDEFKNYIYSHAQALNDLQSTNDTLKNSSSDLTKTCVDYINENTTLILRAKHNLDTYLNGGEKQ